MAPSKTAAKGKGGHAAQHKKSADDVPTVKPKSKKKKITAAAAITKELKAEKVEKTVLDMKERTLEYMEEMGQIGTGIQHEGDINMNDPNSFTTKWVLGQSDEDDETDKESDDEEGGSGLEGGFDANHLSTHNEDIDREDEEELEEVDQAPKEDECTGKLIYSGCAIKSQAIEPKTVMEHFAEVAESEEVAAQKRADVEQVRSRTELARVKAKGHVALKKEKHKMERLKLTVEMKKLRVAAQPPS
ncbi:hypothetical protein PILCRDRAFT_93282 [Piloderma croceum F 1598]|uniref:Uncharacterized protein n=1 Tax=Piloderma croceum (strain F 1598) TaxID=765440 RepID=A0A0C3B6C5_PILCF|nr:hypothetical protein PILCRDRAFT_93282 [Piloderma croceum F 1598]